VGGLAHRNPKHFIKEAASVFESESGALFYIGFQELPGTLIGLGMGAGVFPQS
jgi:hypothetical protein